MAQKLFCFVSFFWVPLIECHFSERYSSEYCSAECNSSGYLKKLDYSKHIHFNKSAFSRHKTRQVGWQGRQNWSFNMHTLTVNIFVVSTNRTIIHNKTRGTCHLPGWQKSTSTRAQVVMHKARQVGWQARQAWTIAVLTLNANIFVAGNNRTIIYNMTVQ